MAAVELGRYLRSGEERYLAGIEASVECWLACEVCSDACLGEENVAEMVRCIRLDRDCAEMCRAATGAMVRGSDMVAEICRACADLCAACATECERHSHHEHCRRCAEACRRCEQECRRIAA